MRSWTSRQWCMIAKCSARYVYMLWSIKSEENCGRRRGWGMETDLKQNILEYWRPVAPEWTVKGGKVRLLTSDCEITHQYMPQFWQYIRSKGSLEGDCPQSAREMDERGKLLSKTVRARRSNHLVAIIVAGAISFSWNVPKRKRRVGRPCARYWSCLGGLWLWLAVACQRPP